MNHRWSKQIKGSHTIKKVMYSDREISITLNNIKECVNCGLRKGTYRQGWNWTSTVYYHKHEGLWLSENKLPYSCDRRKDILFSKEEFML